MSAYSGSFTPPESLVKTQEELRKLAASALAVSEVWKSTISHCDFSGTRAALNAYRVNCENISKQMSQISNVVKSVVPLIDALAQGTLKNATEEMTRTLQSVDWKWVVKAYTDAFGDEGDENQDISEKIEETITSEIQAEIAEDAIEALSHPKQMHVASQSKYLQWKEKHPFLADIYMQVFLTLLASLIFLGIEWGMGAVKASITKDTRVYNEPSSKSNTVFNITVNQSVIVIDEVPYFYKVEFTDPETGELVTGYIYKGNITAEESDEPEVQKE